MARSVELRRHTASDSDRLTPPGVKTAVVIGSRLAGGYDRRISSDLQRATQTLACFLAGLGQRLAGGVEVNPRFASEVQDRRLAAASQAGNGRITDFEAADAELVETGRAASAR